MNRKRHWYFMTALKVLATIVVAICASAFMFGFAAGFFNSLFAGYIAGCWALVMGVYGVVAVIRKDVRRNRIEVEKRDEA